MTSRPVVDTARWAGSASLSSLSDSRLVDLTRDGNEPAFEAIVARYREPLLRYGSRLLPGGHAHRAEDVVQQALANAHRALLRDGREVNLRPWLYRITHNQAINSLRDRDWEHTRLSESMDGVEPPDQVAERRDELRRLFTVIRALPESERVALIRHELGGESHERIGADLGLTPGAVRQLAYRARTTVRKAGAALLQAPLLSRLPWGGGSAAQAGARLATGGGGALGAKLIATLAATGALAGGTAMVVETRGENPLLPDSAGVPAAGSGDRFDSSRSTQERDATRHAAGQGADRGQHRDEHSGAEALGERSYQREGSPAPSGGRIGGEDNRDAAAERGDDNREVGGGSGSGGGDSEPGDGVGSDTGDADIATEAPSIDGSGTDDSLTSQTASGDARVPSAGSPADSGDDGASGDS